MKNETVEICNLMQCIEHLKQEGDFPSEEHKFRCNEITRESCTNFKVSSIGTKNLQSSVDLSTNPPTGLARSSASSARHSQQLTPVEYFKRVIKRDSRHFTNFK